VQNPIQVGFEAMDRRSVDQFPRKRAADVADLYCQKVSELISCESWTNQFELMISTRIVKIT